MYHHGNLRESLLREAAAQARTGGAEKVSLRASARRTGVSHAAAYRHFTNRRALLAAVATRAMEELASKLESAVERATTPLEQGCAVGVAYLEWAVAEPGLFRIAFWKGLEDKEPYPDLRAASDRASLPVLRAAQAWLTGEVGVGRHDLDGSGSGRSVPGGGVSPEARELAVSLWAHAHGMAELLLGRQLSQGELRLDGPPLEDASRQLERGLIALMRGHDGDVD